VNFGICAVLVLVPLGAALLHDVVRR